MFFQNKWYEFTILWFKKKKLKSFTSSKSLKKALQKFVNEKNYNIYSVKIKNASSSLIMTPKYEPVQKSSCMTQFLQASHRPRSNGIQVSCKDVIICPAKKNLIRDNIYVLYFFPRVILIWDNIYYG